MNLEYIYQSGLSFKNRIQELDTCVKNALIDYGIDLNNDLILCQPPIESMQIGQSITVLTTELEYFEFEINLDEISMTDKTIKLVISNTCKGNNKESIGMLYVRALLRLNKCKINL